MIGRTLGHYRIVERLGRGGMGEVYAAEDLRLKRRVALKVLPAETAGNPGLRARFEREAQALAALNHPHIVTVFSVEEEASVPFLTMELIDGTTLRERIPPGGLGLAPFLDWALPLTSALAAAHAQGIAHRDLKPDNVMIGSDGRLKVLDFGLAAEIGSGRVGADDLTRGPSLTRVGQIVGTLAYMSPEQLDGKPVDSRSDLFSLGIVLYEMATGRHPFAGASTARTMSAILNDTPPPLERSGDALPDGLARIVARCLEKHPCDRPASALEVSRALETLRGHSPVVPRTRRGRRASPILFLLGVTALVFAAVLLRDQGEDGDPATREAPARVPVRGLSQLTSGAGLEEWPAWSPDGTRIVYTAESDGFKKLFVKDVGGGSETRLTSGPNDDIQPAWSADGAQIAFVRASEPGGTLEPADVLSGEYSGGDVWILDLASGETRKVLENAFNPSYSPDGRRLAVDAPWAGPRRIWISDASGRNPEQATTDQSEAVSHTQPKWSPDGRRIVFQSAEKTKFDVRVVDLASKATTWVTDDGFQDLSPAWSPDGSWIYFSSHRGGGLNVWRMPVSAAGQPMGSPEQLTTGAGQDVRVAPAPDGRRLTFGVLQQNADLWRLPLDARSGEPTGPPERVSASTREESRGAWSPDGRAIAFNSDRDGPMSLWVRDVETGSERRLTTGDGGDYQPAWSPDGLRIVFFSSRGGNADVWSVIVADGALSRLTDDPALDINPFWSPDGARIAFQSDREGRLEVWTMGGSGSDQRRLADVGAGGHFLRWSDDSASVYFLGGDRRLRRARITGGTADDLGAIGGAHISFSPDRSRLIDVQGHKSVWVYPLDGAPPRRVFEFAEPDVRIDYPFWSPDGRWLLFDRVAPQGGDIWLLDGLG